MVRSTATNWAKGSILAVDAGIHLAGIIRILNEHLPYAIRRQVCEPLELLPKTPTKARPAPLVHSRRSSPRFSGHASTQSNYFPHIPEQRSTRAGSPFTQPEASKPLLVLSTGPFTNLEVPYESSKANAAYLLRNLISTYLITHPHLDHLSGFAVNTASFQHTSRPKKLAALPSTIDAIKRHIFNDVIWPNLSDEEGGVGLVSYMRLVEGGNVALGEGEGKGYIELCDGLAVKSWSVSHGHCMKRHSHRGSNGEIAVESGLQRNSQGHSSPSTIDQPPKILSHREGPSKEDVCVYDSAAFFIRDEASGKEVLIFGDVEPDSVSLSPRTARVWTNAASKIVAGLLCAIFIECSYDDSQSNETLFGHLAPRHLVAELQTLADLVESLRHPNTADSQRKRKRESIGLKAHEDTDIRTRWGRNAHQTRQKGRTSSISPFSGAVDDLPLVNDTSIAPLPMEESMPALLEYGGSGFSTVPASRSVSDTPPLLGLQVVIIHVKDTLKDGPDISDVVLSQLQQHEEEAKLGCSFTISTAGTSIWL